MLGIQLRDNYAPDIAAGFIAEEAKWIPCAPASGVAFMCFNKAGEPRHVGIVVNGGSHILHARSPSVKCDRIELMRRYNMKFYKYKGE